MSSPGRSEPLRSAFVVVLAIVACNVVFAQLYQSGSLLLRNRPPVDLGYFPYYTEVLMDLRTRPGLSDDAIAWALRSGERFTGSHDLEARPFSHAPLNYNPVFFLFWRLLAGLPYAFVTAAWNLLNILLLWASFGLLAWKFRLHRTRAHLLFALIFFAGFAPIATNLAAGQVNIVTFFLLAILLCCADRAPALAGAALALAVIVKTIPALFLIHVVLSRRWRLLAAFAGTAGLLFAVSCHTWGFAVHRVWILKVLPVSAEKFVMSFPNFSLLGFTTRIGSMVLPPEAAAVLGRFVWMGALGAGVFAAWRYRRADESLRLSYFCALLLIFSTFIEDHHYLFLLIPLLHLFSIVDFQRTGVAFAWGAGYLLVGQKIHPDGISMLHHGPLQVFLYPKLAGSILVLLLTLFFLRRDALGATNSSSA